MVTALAIAFIASSIAIERYVRMGDAPIPSAYETAAASASAAPLGVVAGVVDDSEASEEGLSIDTSERTLDFMEYSEYRRTKDPADIDASVSTPHENTGAPVRITIPGIAVNAAVEKVALAADGSMDVPRHPSNVAWYALGPRPGETGSATITGHVDWVDGATAVFADLHKVKPGDKITVEDDRGAVTRFTVREIRTYDADADATDIFVSHDGKAHLNIITCVGTWDARAGQYSERLVVFADKEGE